MMNLCSMALVFRAQRSTVEKSTFFMAPIHDSIFNSTLVIGIDSLAQEGRNPLVASGNMFANAILGGGLDPKSNDNFSIYAFETTSTHSDVGATI